MLYKIGTALLLLILLFLGLTGPLAQTFQLKNIAQWTRSLAVTPMFQELSVASGLDVLGTRLTLTYWVDGENANEVDLQPANFSRFEGPFMRRWTFYQALIAVVAKRELNQAVATGQFLRAVMCGEHSPFSLISGTNQEIWKAELRVDNDDSNFAATSLGVTCLQ